MFSKSSSCLANAKNKLIVGEKEGGGVTSSCVPKPCRPYPLLLGPKFDGMQVKKRLSQQLAADLASFYGVISAAQICVLKNLVKHFPFSSLSF